MSACNRAACMESVFQLPQVLLRATVRPPVVPRVHWLQRQPYSTVGDSTTRHCPHHHHHAPSRPRALMSSRYTISLSTGSLHSRTLHTGQRAASSRWGHLTSVEDAQEYLASMPVPQRQCLERAVLDARKEQESDEEDVTPPTWKQLKLCEQRVHSGSLIPRPPKRA